MGTFVKKIKGMNQVAYNAAMTPVGRTPAIASHEAL